MNLGHMSNPSFNSMEEKKESDLSDINVKRLTSDPNMISAFDRE